MGYSMKGSPHKMGTIKGTSSHASAVKQKSQQQIDREHELRQQEIDLANKKIDKTDDGGRKASTKFVKKHDDNIEAYTKEIELLKESGATEKEIDKIRRKKDKSSSKLERGQLDWSEILRAAGDSITGLGASWGTGRWMGGSPGVYDYRREVERPETDDQTTEEGDPTGVKPTTGKEAFDKSEKSKIDHNENLKGKTGKERTEYYVENNLAFDETITDKEGYTDPADKFK